MKTRYHRCAFLAMLLSGINAHSQTAGQDGTGSNSAERRIEAGGRINGAPTSPTPLTRQTPSAKKLAGAPRSVTSVTLLGSVTTASPAESFAMNGNLAYVCDDNEISVVNIANPASLQIVATALSGLIHNSGLTYCSLQRNTLSVFADQATTLIGNTPGFSAFSLANPLQPQLIQATPINKRLFEIPVYIGNYAFVPTLAITADYGVFWNGQFGDLLAVDLTNFSNPVLQPQTLEQPQINPQFGGATAVLGATQADSALLYLGGSTSTSNRNNGTGRLQVVDVSNPSAMKVVTQRLIPGTIHFSAPLIQGTVAVGIGNTGGFVGNVSANPFVQGNIVVSVLDVSDRRSPAVLSINTTGYQAGAGGGAVRIGNYLFAFAGVADTNNNPLLLIVDATNPVAPVLQTIPIPRPFTSMQSIGTTLYATLGSGGFAAYSIPGIGSGPASVCPAFVDAMLVVDRGMNISGSAFLDAKTALQSFVNTLHFPADQAGVASFTNTANVDKQLTTSAAQAMAAFDGIVAGGTSYIGAGIAAAQAELTGPRHNAAATPMIVIVSDGVDAGAPNPASTLAAANAAKAAGIRIISVQYGSSTGTLMQSIASATSDFYQVGQ